MIDIHQNKAHVKVLQNFFEVPNFSRLRIMHQQHTTQCFNSHILREHFSYLRKFQHQLGYIAKILYCIINLLSKTFKIMCHISKYLKNDHIFILCGRFSPFSPIFCCFYPFRVAKHDFSTLMITFMHSTLQILSIDMSHMHFQES